MRKFAMNHKYCPTCFLENREQVEIITHDIEKSVQGKEENRCIKRRHKVKGAGLSLPGLIQLEKFYRDGKS